MWSLKSEIGKKVWVKNKLGNWDRYKVLNTKLAKVDDYALALIVHDYLSEPCLVTILIWSWWGLLSDSQIWLH